MNNTTNKNDPISNLQLFLKEHHVFQSPKIQLIHNLITKVESSKPELKQSFCRKGHNVNKQGLNQSPPKLETNLSLRAHDDSKKKKSQNVLNILKSLHSSEKSLNSDFGKEDVQFESIQDLQKDSLEVPADIKSIEIPISSFSTNTATGSQAQDIIKNENSFENVLKLKTKCRSADLIYLNEFKMIIDDMVKLKFACKEDDDLVPLRRTKSDLMCSVMLKSQVLDPIRILSKEIWKELSDENISLDFQSYQTIASIQFSSPRSTTNKQKKFSKNDSPSQKLRAVELEQLQENIKYFINRSNLSRSQSLYSLNQLLSKVLNKFSTALSAENIKSNDVLIDYISLPLLLSKTIDPEDNHFFRQLVVYTYDLYMSPMDLLLYLIAQFFNRERRGIHKNSLQNQKIEILEFIEFWFEERTSDFALDSDLNSLLKSFLQSLQSQTDSDDPDFIRALKSLQSTYKAAQHAVFARHKRIHFTHSHSLFQPQTIFEEKQNNEDSKTSFVKKCSQESMFYGLVTLRKRAFTFSMPLGKMTIKANTEYRILFEIPAIEIAKQLTLLEWKSFSRVNIREVIKMRWTKKDKAQCPNYWKYVSHFNNFSYWLQYIILIQENHADQLKIVKEFIDIAFICIQQYRNYSTPHYIFSAFASLKNFGVLDFDECFKNEYVELKNVFASEESHMSLYDRIYRDIKMPAVPSLISFLKIFQKLQEGVAFEVKLPESKLKHLNLQRIIQVQDYMIEMKKFQKKDYDLFIEKNRKLYSYLKEGFKKEIPIDLENSDTGRIIQKLTELAQKYKKQQQPKNKEAKENRFSNIANKILKKREEVY